MIMFCGLPVIVAMLPTLEAIGIASRYGIGSRFSRLTRSSTSGVMTRQIVSLTRKAEKRAGHHHDRHQQDERMAGARHDPIAHQPEKAGKAQVGDDDHHAEQERDGVEIDRAIGLVERDDA